MSNIVRSTLQQATKGQEYEELEYVLDSTFCSTLVLDIADSIASIIDVGQDSINEIEPEETCVPKIQRIIHPHLLTRLVQKIHYCPFYHFLASAALSNDFDIFIQIYKIGYPANKFTTYQLVKILALVINAGYYMFAKRFLLCITHIDLSIMSHTTCQKAINTLFKLYFELLSQDLKQRQQDVAPKEIDINYQKMAYEILKLVGPSYRQHEIIYYASGVTDDQFKKLWNRYSQTNRLDIQKWLANPSQHLKQQQLKSRYDQQFLNHLQRIYKHLKRNQLKKQQQQQNESTQIKTRLNPPPLEIEYIGIWNQCLEQYYFNKDNKKHKSLLMFESSDGIDKNNGRLNKLITTSIYFNNDKVLDYFLNRIKKEIGPFQTMVIENEKEEDEGNIGMSEDSFDVYVGDPNPISTKVFNILVDDNVMQLVAEAMEQDKTQVIRHLLRKPYKLHSLNVISSNTTIRECARKNELQILRLVNSDFGEPPDPPIKEDGLLKDIVTRSFQRFYQKEWKFGRSLQNGAETVVKYIFELAQRERFKIKFHALKSIDPIFCSRDYINLLNEHIAPTIKQASKGKEYVELDFVLESPFAKSLIMDVVDTVQSIISIPGDSNYHLIERVAEYVDQNTEKCITQLSSIGKYITDEYSATRDQLVSIIGKILDDTDFDETQNLPMSYYSSFPQMVSTSTICRKNGHYDKICPFYFFLSSAAISTDVAIYQRVYDIGYNQEGDEREEIEFLEVTPIEMDSLSIEQFKKAINKIFKLYFNLLKKYLESKQEVEQVEVDYQQLANDILELVEFDIQKWFSTVQLKQLKYDEKFANHLERIYNHLKQDQLKQYQTIQIKLDPPPLDLKYIAILNQWLYKYYFNKDTNNNNNNNNNNSLINNYTQKEYNQFIDRAIEIGFVPNQFKK
ncbi:hypothetical protein DFA_10328 [Cavenderia fasciculata]|uniref:Uncharacterized protein n=1 Tax=Cavenderia fasciculata TaxID=261658 RepID=F4Q9W9_CACFS|nr:uncharacterized protein DFA_10328 [Cavenderia fasciculata]EGG15488.1 hypothetical protein DFA_10328 [Cavenderia fasciculata]|eukprot:XP_004354230.1 hypothetical protein DFA_10328 [Cavenderia fasciculata]